MRVVVLFSGGLDSTVLLWHLKAEGHHVSALAVDYGQRNVQELGHADLIAAKAGVPFRVVPFPRFADLAPLSSQTNAAIPLPGADEDAHVTVVPNRNMVLLAVGTAYAIGEGAKAVAYGAHAGGHEGYPDTRPAFVSAMSHALAVCDWEPVTLLAPFLMWAKSGVVARGADLGAPLALTCSCYDGGRGHCGKCRACRKRQQAFIAAGVKDETEYVLNQ